MLVASVQLCELERGDIVILELEGSLLTKRLVGLPGETIEIRSGQVFINGSMFSEPYEVIQKGRSFPAIELGENEYYILGDNRPFSNDSRSFGPIPSESILQRVVP